MQQHRDLGRRFDEIRPVNVAYNLYGHADSSVLFSTGKTQVLCAVTIQQGVPKFLRGKGTGWLTAEYGVLPTAMHERVTRESSSSQRDGRSVEISRIIGRVLRTCVDLSGIGESTIIVDCDILCADGGTRVASINAAHLALAKAEEYWLSIGRIKHPFLVQHIAAVSIGITENNSIIVDPDYKEDSRIIADLNIIATKNGIIEVQGGAEKRPITWDLFGKVCSLAQQVLQPFFNEELSVGKTISHETSHDAKVPLFSLKNRLALHNKE